MRIYLELFEIAPPDSNNPGDFVRVDVTGWDQGEVDNAIQLLKEHAQAYDHYVLQIHYCYHDEGKPCTITIIDSR